MPEELPAAVHLQDLRVRFGGLRALDGLCLRALSGEIYGLLGRNGAGKTTTLRILMGIVKPDSGVIELLGERVKRIPVALKQRIGYVSQEQTFYPWMTAKELGAFVGSFYPRWDGVEYTRLLRVLDVPLTQRSGVLSGGTRAKLALALALAPRPDLLLLDEPTTGLDPVARREFNDLLAASVKERGTTTVFSSHLVDEVASIASRVGIVQAGSMRIEGGVAELQARVRVVRGALPTELPAGLSPVRGGVLQGTAEAWAGASWGDGVFVESLSLEEIFLAFARTDQAADPSVVAA
jgi:ABC-2 type transport system ATP-binding protein